MLLRAETLAGDGHHAHFAQQSPCNISRRTNPATPKETGNIRVDIKRAFRISAKNARNGLQSLQNTVAKVDVLSAKLSNAVLWPFEGRNCCLLRNRIGI